MTASFEDFISSVPSRVGRPKLREIDDHPQAFIHDPRSRLYLK